VIKKQREDAISDFSFMFEGKTKIKKQQPINSIQTNAIELE